MRRSRAASWALALWAAFSLAVQACSPRQPPPLETAFAAAIAALPWDRDSAGWPAFCSRDAPCDTLLIEPRVVRLPSQPPAFFVPEARPLALDLSRAPRVDMVVLGRPSRYADWAPCFEGRHEPGWKRSRIACVAIGVAGGGAVAADTVRLALLVVTPGIGFAWPHLRLVADDGRWRVRRLWMGVAQRP